MEIILGKSSGFCSGVKNAIDGAEKELKKHNSVYCLGEIIHNEEVIKDLEGKGLVIVDNIEEVKDIAIIRSHGVPKYVYEIANSKNIKLLDYTCPFVSNIHKTVAKYAEDNYFIFLLGIKSHPETIGTISFCGNNSFLIESLNEVSLAINEFQKSGLKDLIIISQTTFSVSLFEEIISEVKSRLTSNINLEIKNTICNTTSIRQKETESIAKKVDLMIVIGGKHSSNTKKLFDVAKKNCKNTLFIQTKNDLEYTYLQNFNKIGIIAGASTPQNIIEDVVDFCKN
ncbi:MAG: 4-hydroxy-3-methylbut-2-enyl diphosphate reductase [Clostridia bacterium]|nr:4-hydroxy-3-methylbut-2-enyl diphosphate reductase [Clostridia bacterium]